MAFLQHHLALLQRIRSLPQRRDKIAVLEPALQDPEFRRIVQLALNPYIRFGITDYELSEDSSRERTMTFFEFLDGLAQRRYQGEMARELAGHFAIADESVEQILRCILNKDLEWGLSPQTVNSLAPGLLPEFRICRSVPYDPQRPLMLPAFTFPIYGGRRCLAICENPATVFLLNRDGLPIRHTDAIKNALVPLLEQTRGGFVLDGELASDGDDDSDRHYHYHVSDYLPLPIFLAGRPYQTVEERHAFLDELLPEADGPITLAPWTLIQDSDTLMAQQRIEVELGYRGLLIKLAGSPYEFKRSQQWLEFREPELPANDDAPTLKSFQ